MRYIEHWPLESQSPVRIPVGPPEPADAAEFARSADEFLTNFKSTCPVCEYCGSRSNVAHSHCVNCGAPTP